MSQPPPESLNPYQSPAVAQALLEPADWEALRLQERLKGFQSQILALGVLWIVIGLGGFLLGIGTLRAEFWYRKPDPILLGVWRVIGLTLVALGLLICFKRIWAVQVSLALCLLLCAASVAMLGVCSLLVIVIIAVVALQTYRILGWANELRDAGIPLNSRPSDLRAI